MQELFEVLSFYKFIPIDAAHLGEVEASLENLATELDLCGLVILAAEGVNATVAGMPPAISRFENFLDQPFGVQQWHFKRSISKGRPFRRFRVRIRDEIVTSEFKELEVSDRSGHLSPEEWQAVLDSDEEITLLDMRNTYETEVGMFKGAVDPRLANFQQFPEYVENSNLSKDKKVLMYCTGGIRCEKAALEMRRQGYEKVFQLSGGILEYLKTFPEGSFKGECFVFDHRVALDKHLRPSESYTLCPHCGDPGKEKIECLRCERPARICHRCLDRESARNSCSKDCAYHLRVGTRRT